MDPVGWRIAILFISSIVCVVASLVTGADIRESSQEDNSRYGLGVSVRTVTGIVIAVLMSTVATTQFFSLLAPVFESTAITAVLSVGCSLLYFSLFLMIPFFIGQAKSEKFSSMPAWITVASSILAPLTQLLMLPSRLAVHLAGVEKDLTEITEEDVMELVDTAEDDVIDSDQKEMIGNIFELDDVNCGDIAVHRTEVVGVSASTPIPEVVETAVKTGYSRLPVYESSLDNIIGVCHIKDLLPFLANGEEDVDLKKVMRPVLYVPETYKAYDLLRDFRQKKNHLAVVVDEYGGTSGIVTMEDILETIVGDIEDEYDTEEQLFHEQPDGSIISDGYAEIEDIYNALGLELPDGADEEFDTVGGLVTDLLGYIPQENDLGQKVSNDELEFTVLGSDGKRVTKVRTVALSKNPSEEKEE